MSNVTDILQEARDSYLNDPSGGEYTDAKLLPKLKTAYALMETALIENKIQCKNAEAVKTITAGTSEYSPLPNDLFIPTKMEERDAGSSNTYRPMYLMRNLPADLSTPSPMIQYWSWREDRIYLSKAGTDREVRLIYQKLFPAIGTIDDAIYGKVEQYLSAKVAAFVFMFVENKPDLAKVANEVAEAELEQMINIQTKLTQAVPIRRRPYVPFRLR